MDFRDLPLLGMRPLVMVFCKREAKIRHQSRSSSGQVCQIVSLNLRIDQRRVFKVWLPFVKGRRGKSVPTSYK